MELQEQRQGAVTVLRPKGPLAGDDAAHFRKRADQLLAGSLGRFVVDASNIPYVDSQGLEALLDVTEEMAESGQALRLCHANDTLREVLELTGLASSFEHFEDVNAAVRSFL